MRERVREQTRLRKKSRRLSYKKSPEFKKFKRKNLKERFSRSLNYKNEKRNIKKVSLDSRDKLRKSIESNNGINIDIFRNKVLAPAKMILEKAGYKKVDFKFLFKIGLMENMGGKGGKEELENALKKFSGENYKDLMKVRSHKGAKGIFQVMPRTSIGLNKNYKIPNLIENERQNLIKNFGFKQEDFKILENTLQGAFMIIETIEKYKLTNEYQIAGAYNMGPSGYKRAIKTGKIPLETQNYLKKLNFINNFLNKYNGNIEEIT